MARHGPCVKNNCPQDPDPLPTMVHVCEKQRSTEFGCGVVRFVDSAAAREAWRPGGNAPMNVVFTRGPRRTAGRDPMDRNIEGRHRTYAGS